MNDTFDTDKFVCNLCAYRCDKPSILSYDNNRKYLTLREYTVYLAGLFMQGETIMRSTGKNVKKLKKLLIKRRTDTNAKDFKNLTSIVPMQWVATFRNTKTLHNVINLPNSVVQLESTYTQSFGNFVLGQRLIFF